MEKGIRINPLDYDNLKCDKCGNETFTHNIILKKIPGIVVGAGKEDQVIDLPVFVCAKCGAILKDYREMYKLEEFKEDKKPAETQSFLSNEEEQKQNITKLIL